MTTDSESTQAAPEAAPAPADTPAPPAPDTGANTQQSPQPTEAETRYRALQSEYTRTKERAIAAEKELAELRAAAEAPDDEGDEATPRRATPRANQREAELQERLQEAEWTIARAIYPDPVIEAYNAAAGLLENAQTAADYVGAFEAYHLARTGGATPQEAAASTTPPPAAFVPRVDPNRSDAPVLPEPTQALREAEQKHDLAAWVKAKLAGAPQV